MDGEMVELEGLIKRLWQGDFQFLYDDAPICYQKLVGYKEQDKEVLFDAQ